MGFFTNKNGNIKIGSIVFSAVVAVAAAATLISACAAYPSYWQVNVNGHSF